MNQNTFSISTSRRDNLIQPNGSALGNKIAKINNRPERAALKE